mmetsp:Transcript_21565/g.31899  ORF Transcript_21565/g.31899 Transcript_21565/m.31899 type:complete len:304 (+) Transcript_21565:37-948(+)
MVGGKLANEMPLKCRRACHEDVLVNTTGRREHTVCGIMFPVEIKRDVPIEKVTIQSLSVRGQLGPITVWAAGIKVPQRQENNFFHYHIHGAEEEQVLMYSRTWHKVYQSFREPSNYRYTSFEISPVTLKPGESCIFYIHSSHRSRQGILSANAQNHITFQDDAINIHAGRAHFSTRPFGSINIWGYHGAWRDDCAFVGQLRYCVTYISWKPNIHIHFGYAYAQMVLTLLMCRRRSKSPISLLSDDNLYLILQMCGFNWASACYATKRKRNRPRIRKMIQSQKNDGSLNHSSCLPWRMFFKRRV